ncbi:MAG TPA: hypothetical protein VGC96_11955 [Candidatus Elarobacter sp.]
MTGVLYLRQRTAPNADNLRIFRELLQTEPHYGVCRRPRCTAWSDVPMWDAVAALRTYGVTHDAVALRNAEAAYRFVAASDVFARGACPAIEYQRPHAESGGLKTLETAGNAALAGVLLFQHTGHRSYLADAARRYAAARAWFLDPQVQLYTVYVFDDGRGCRPLAHRFFASVNGIMIETGLRLARATGDARYLRGRARDGARDAAARRRARRVRRSAGRERRRPAARAGDVLARSRPAGPVRARGSSATPRRPRTRAGPTARTAASSTALRRPQP